VLGRMAEKDGAAGEKAGDKNAVTTWSGVASIWDFKATGPHDAKAVPFKQYLEEATIGLRHGIGDPRLKSKQKDSGSEEERPPSRGLKSGPAQLVEMLRALLNTEAALSTGTALFWLVLAAVFETLPAMAIDMFRGQLGHAWHSFCLEVDKKMPTDMEARDWLLDAVPFVYAQGMYRMLVDGFDEERKQFLTHVKNFMNKIALVIHFEINGFQINVDTVRRARRKLFLARVLSSPHSNQHDYLKGQRRQAELEANKSSSGPRPLNFGKVDAPPVDEVQLEHVMIGRMDALTDPNARLLASGQKDNFAVPDELSVDRYANLTGIGIAMLDRHLCDIFAGVEDEMEEEEEDVKKVPQGDDDDEAVASNQSRSHPGSPDSGSPPGSPLSRSSPSAFSSTMPATMGSPTAKDGNEVEDEEDDGPHNMASTFDPNGPQARKKARLKKAKMAGTMALMRIKANEKREEEAKMKRQRSELALLKLSSSPEALPEEYCARELDTTWVTPAMQSLHPDAVTKAQVLHKPRAETFALKMEAHAARPGTLSMPALKGRASTASGERTKASDAMTVSATSLKDGSASGGVERTKERTNSVAYDKPVQTTSSSGTQRLNLSQSGPLPKVGSETLILEPPSSISNKVILNRLETTSKAFRAHSFAIYMKEYDVFTGIKKQRFDEKRLRDEEDAYLRKMNRMVGGEPKRMLYPDLGRNGKNRSSGRRPQTTPVFSTTSAPL